MNGKTPKRKKQKWKATQKQLALMERIVLTSTEKNDLILDSFTSSSTTGIAPYQQGRRFMGIDKNNTWIYRNDDLM